MRTRESSEAPPQGADRGGVYVFASLVLGLTLAACAHSAPADLDISFGPNGTGRAEYSFDNVNASVSAMSVQSDGRLVIAGTCGSTESTEMCVLRTSPNGLSDIDFGSQGFLRLGTGVGSGASALAIQPDKKILLGGRCRNGGGDVMCVVRLAANGAIDAAFGVNGRALIPQATRAQNTHAMALLPDGRIIALGRCAIVLKSEQFCAARLLANGAIDVSFGNAGVAIVATQFANVIAHSTAVVEGGKLMIAGQCLLPTNQYGVCAARLLADGQLDPSFATNGVASFPVGAGSVEEVATKVRQQADGKLILLGYCLTQQADRFCTMRLNADGRLDATFGAQGRVVAPADLHQIAWSGALQRDGKLLLVGQCKLINGAAAPDFCFVRYNTDGSIDAATGRVTTNVSNAQIAKDVYVLDDGNFLLAGICNGNGRDLFCVNRYEGGPFSYSMCSLDIDGDGVMNPAIDSLLLARATLGFTGAAAYAGITFAANATRTQWGSGGNDDIRKFLVLQCGLKL